MAEKAKRFRDTRWFDLSLRWNL